ncbi:MAG: DUF4398 domain-containing protein [Deltaproteobacteria bacterium]|nr:MAG: DUF4398 domain-containing protein [Deltaproteobacteria bacterium]
MGRSCIRIVPKGGRVLFLLFLFVAAVGLGCQTRERYREAEAAVEAARDAGAARFAPFEFVSAEEYLEEAEAQLKESDFKTSERYSQKAKEFAEAALARSMEARQQMLVR